MKELVSAIRSAGFENVYLMERRYATIWAGASLLSMVLDVLRTALYSLKWTTWDFMMNLSESDFPVLSMAELEIHLARCVLLVEVFFVAGDEVRVVYDTALSLYHMVRNPMEIQAFKIHLSVVIIGIGFLA